LEQDLKLKNNEMDDFNDISKKINNIYEEIKDVKEKLRRYPFILEKGEKLMSIIISSRDEKMLYSLPCKNNNTINDIEKKFYKEFPEYFDNKNIFLYKGKLVDKFETLQKNNIKNGDILILEFADNINIVMNQKFKNPNFVDYYDVIVHIDSIKNINKGWKIEMNQIGKQNYQNNKNEKLIKIGVIGNANTGKSFLLSKISKMVLPSGMSIKTEGLSIKYPDLNLFKNRRIVLLDSAGLDYPVLISDENQNSINKIDLFKEKFREKLITELFLQNYIMHYSDILIIVVDSLSFSEQKLLMKIKKEIDKAKLIKPLFIIHNLKSFTSVEQVKDYIYNSLLKSATFTLEDGQRTTMEFEDRPGIYFYEKDKEKYKERNIFHLIFANEDSEAGKYYNPFTLTFIENYFSNIQYLKSFDVIDSIKERFMAISKDILNGNGKKITKESFDNSFPYMIKLKGENEIILKKCLIDELVFTNLKANGFEPTYNIYKKDNKIIVRVETPGNIFIESIVEILDEYYIIKIKGEKSLDKEPEKLDDNIYNTREYGKFCLEIPLKIGEYLLAREPPEINVLKGVLILKYNLVKKEEIMVFKGDYEDI